MTGFLYKSLHFAYVCTSVKGIMSVIIYSLEKIWKIIRDIWVLLDIKVFCLYVAVFVLLPSTF